VNPQFAVDPIEFEGFTEVYHFNPLFAQTQMGDGKDTRELV
jgi:hypothetical protein